MLSFGLTQQISYFGLPKKYQDASFVIKTFDDLFLLLFDICRYNISIGSKVVCLDFNEIEIDPSFLSAVPEEEKKETSNFIIELNSLIKKNDLRVCLSLTKDFFLGSQLGGIAEKTIQIIQNFSLLLDCIGVNYPSIIIRVGSAYGNRKITMKSFCEKVSLFSPSVVEKIIVTNDDKPSLFSITDLLSGVYYESGIPICFRSLPHYFNDGGLSAREAFFLACSTWKKGFRPLYIYGESAETDKFGFPMTSKTAGNLTRRIPTFGLDCDIIIDSFERESCMLRYLSEVKSLHPVVFNKVSKS